MTIESLISALEIARQTTLDRFSTIDPAALDQPRTWRGAPSNLRFLLNWLTEGSESRRVQILSAAERLEHRFADAQRGVMLLGQWRGHLRGTLIGLSDADFDRDPAPGEWSIRRVLGHVIATDERYGIAVRYALDRARPGGGGPLRPDESSLPSRTGEAQSTGTPRDLCERLWQVRWPVLESIAAVPDALLTAPTNWVSWDLDVRFRIHRFSAHDREHAIQIQKARQALSLPQTEPQLLLADAMVELSALEATLLCAGDGILDQQPRGGGPTIAELAQDCLSDELALHSDPVKP